MWNLFSRPEESTRMLRNSLLKIEELTEDIPFFNTITNFESEQNKGPEEANIREEMVRKKDSLKFKEFNGIFYTEKTTIL
ncbi:hypothetical protein TNIN_427511 [Trichonephila inaurata madagascariensis]|uniref:Uncharacterized protein n=1 Tax=Trichonephila inaurata madagascariensis TaxID=2747483 RepID=A0A8X7CLQ3_9ARAC|nr:hypothetical protein TNIN_427511 [Trichonephila inaurata madagascariensis]